MYTYSKCVGCGLVRLADRSTQNGADLYPKGYYSTGAHVRLSRRLLCQAKLRSISRLKPRGRLLDVGCGDGEFLRVASEFGYNVWGTDISDASLELAGSALRNRIRKGAVSECNFLPGSFDIAVLNHVVEHFDSPSKELISIRRLLKDDGILFLCSPNIDSLQLKVCKTKWIPLDPPLHRFLFSPDTATSMLQRSGFRVLPAANPIENSFDFTGDFSTSIARMLTPNGSASALKMLLLPPTVLLKMASARFRGSFTIFGQPRL